MRVSVWLFTALVPATGYANLIYNGDFEGRPIGDGWLAGGVARFLEEGGNTLADVRSFYDGAIVNGGDVQQVVRTKPVPGTLCLDLDLTIAYGAFGVYFDDTELFSISSYEEEPLRIRRRLELDASAEMDGEWKVLAISSSCLLRGIEHRGAYRQRDAGARARAGNALRGGAGTCGPGASSNTGPIRVTRQG